MLIFGMAAFGTTSALCSFAQTSTQLIIFRSLMGIGAAAVQPQTLSIIQNVFEPRERGKAIGIWAGASGMAIALGPIAGGALLKYFWWGSVFLVNVPIVVVALVAIFFLVPDSKDPKPGRLDPAGVVLSMVALVVLVYGVIEGGNSNQWLRWDTSGAIVLGIVLLALFVWLQKRSSHPTIDVTLFQNRHFSAGAVAIALTFFALMGSTFYLAYFLQAVRGYTPLAAGVALIAVAAAVMISSPMSARLSTRFGPRIVTGTGMVLFGGAMGSYAFVQQSTPQWVIEMSMVVMGVGMGMTMSPATAAIMSAVPREKAGAGSAVNNTVRQVAGALGVAILGSILAVAFRGNLGASAPADLAAKLDAPLASVQGAPANVRVTPLVHGDTSQSIGNALEFAQQTGQSLQRRAALPGAAALPPAQLAQQKAAATSDVDAFVAKSKSSFVTGMHVTSLSAAGVAWIGAIVAFLFLPSRRELAQSLNRDPSGLPEPEPVLAH
jgi:EmrB/QacA subfamily drug resistance transporter